MATAWQWERLGSAVVVVAMLTAGCSGFNTGGAWTDDGGNEVSTDLLLSRPGPSDHCDWGSATFLFVGRNGTVPGIPAEWYDQYIRDPEDIFRSELAATFDGDATVPADARFTGYSTSTLELWLAPSDPGSLYVRASEKFERWPRVRREEVILCA
jgi:hypothetical protein